MEDKRGKPKDLRLKKEFFRYNFNLLLSLAEKIKAI